ncbi:hypothetical protein YSA_03376 [Pseudomonas putida ND6]|uniref:Uncharacterized protein n=1 Tax=Pseudomonas putida ND6 TaxID=231023 RepID=I3USX7_PSEPU|nr:hypothetical protein YSA_03376 [Pseudomonas putida ND6]
MGAGTFCGLASCMQVYRADCKMHDRSSDGVLLTD